MLANDDSVGEFEGGTVYQVFLSALNYHRWHSPVSGRIVKAFVKEGTYYSETDSEGEDPAGPNNSQGYITQVATRAPIFIQADDPVIGLMCMMRWGWRRYRLALSTPSSQSRVNQSKREKNWATSSTAGRPTA